MPQLEKMMACKQQWPSADGKSQEKCGAFVHPECIRVAGCNSDVNAVCSNFICPRAALCLSGKCKRESAGVRTLFGDGDDNCDTIECTAGCKQWFHLSCEEEIDRVDHCPPCHAASHKRPKHQ